METEMEELHQLKNEFEEVYKNLYTKKLNINSSMESLQREQAKRELKKKEIMLRELKMVLKLFSETETNMIKDLKSCAFDKLSIASNLADNSRELRDEIALAEMKKDFQNISKWKENLQALKKKIADIDLDFLESCLTIEVTGSSSSAEYESLRSQYRDLIFHSAGRLSPKSFVANLADLSVPSQGRLQFSILHVNKAVLKQHFVLEKLKVTVASQAKSPNGGKMIYEECSVLDKIRAQQGVILEDEQNVGQVLVSIKQQNFPVEISVKMFDSNVVGSPRTVAASLISQDSPANGSIAIFDHTVNHDQDESDIACFDNMGRRIQQQLNVHRSFGPGHSIPSRMAPLMEAEEEGGDTAVTRARPQLQVGGGGAFLKSILKQKALMDPPDSASNSPFAPKFKGTMKGDAILKLSEGTYQEKENDIENTLNKSMSVSLNPTLTMPMDEDEEEDPHIHLNESKAPSPTSLKKTIVEDPWEEQEGEDRKELNVSILPNMAEMNQSEWKEQEVDRFNFAIGKLEEVARLEPQLTSVSSSRGEVKCLERPESVALLPGRNLILVSEPLRDRIGLYWAHNYRFVTWFQYPCNEQESKKSFVQPSSLLTREDLLIIIDSEEIFVFNLMDNACVLNFRQKGRFHGLASSSREEFYSISKEAEGTYLVAFRREEIRDWKIRKMILASQLTPETSSNIQFLTVSNSKIFMTDQDCHRLIKVDLNLQTIKYGGYLGHQSGQIYQPAGLLTDDAGNILVCDAGNKRLVLFNEELQHVMDIQDFNQQRPHSLLREGKFVYVVLQGEESPAVIKLKLSVAGE